ncbi:DUF1648 domain-containing protein [Streptomyces sp. NPDC003697]
MNDGRRRGVRWGATFWTLGTAVLIAGLPWAARERLPDPVATHWDLAGDAPDGSMPLWLASLLPALIWLALAGYVLMARRRPGRGPRTARQSAAPVGLLVLGTVLTCVQALLVRANIDHTNWQQARLSPAWIAAPLVAALVAGAVGRRVSGRGRDTDPSATEQGGRGLTLEVPEGQRVVWFSRATNRWLHLLAAGTGLVAAGDLVALAAGLTTSSQAWRLFVPCAIVSLATAVCSSVQARVSERGLEVGFGPLGWPVRRWSPAAMESARAEHRSPAQVGGWGYRFNGLGTTVMLRAGECLVVRVRGRRTDFAVSVDDAQRGAALLNALRTARHG